METLILNEGTKNHYLKTEDQPILSELDLNERKEAVKRNDKQVNITGRALWFRVLIPK